MRAHKGSDAVAVRRARFFPGASAPHRDKNISTFQNAASAPQVMWRNVLLVTESAADGCLATINASGAQPPERFGKKEKAARLAFLGAICERALNLYVCRGGTLWLAYHRTQTQSATQWECLFNPSTDIDSYYSYDTCTRQKCFIRTGYSFQPSIRLNSNNNLWEFAHCDSFCQHVT